jgi:hypothetical protein
MQKVLLSLMFLSIGLNAAEKPNPYDPATIKAALEKNGIRVLTEEEAQTARANVTPQAIKAGTEAMAERAEAFAATLPITSKIEYYDYILRLNKLDVINPASFEREALARRLEEYSRSSK